MYLSKATPIFGGKRQRPSEETYYIHQKIWALFSSDKTPERQKRKFLFTEHNGIYYILSEIPPAFLDNVPFKVVTKEFNPVFNNGQLLQFDLRLNAEKRMGEARERKGITVCYAAVIKENGGEFNWNQVNYEASKQWLTEHSERYGFIVHDYQVMAHDFYDFKNSKNKRVCFNSLDLHGVLEVTDPELFMNTYFTGIGKSKAFGCGMLLIAPFKRHA